MKSSVAKVVSHTLQHSCQINSTDLCVFVLTALQHKADICIRPQLHLLLALLDCFRFWFKVDKNTEIIHRDPISLTLTHTHTHTASTELIGKIQAAPCLTMNSSYPLTGKHTNRVFNTQSHTKPFETVIIGFVLRHYVLMFCISLNTLCFLFVLSDSITGLNKWVR